VARSRFALIGLATLLLFAAAAAVTPAWLDWNRYRDSFARLASTTLGRTVRIDGAMSLQLLPRPEFSAGRISIAAGDDGIAISARQLRLQVSLRGLVTGLLSGHLDPDALVLQQSRISLPWPFNPAALTHRPDWLSGLSARLEDATIVLGTLEFSHVDGSFAPDIAGGTVEWLALASPGLAARAHGQFMGHTWRVMARLGGPLGDDVGDPAGTLGGVPAVPVQLVLDGEGPLADTGASFSGQITGDGAINGTISGRGPDLSQLVTAPAVAWRADGRVSIADGLAVADNLAVQLAGGAGRAAVALRLTPAPRLDLALAAGRIALDGWLDSWVAAARAPALGGDAATKLLTGVDLSADGATFHGVALQRLRLAVDVAPQQVTLREVSALLPGDALLALTGRLAPDSDDLAASQGKTAGEPHATGFDGTVSLTAPDLRATLGALQRIGVLPARAVPDGLLQQGGLAGGLHLAGNRLALEHLTGTLDGSPFSGDLAIQRGDRPAIVGRLVLDRVTLDPLLRDPLSRADVWRFFGPPGFPPALAARLATLGCDIDLRLEVGRAVWSDAVPSVSVNHLIVDAALQGGALMVRSLQGEVAGLQVALSGGLSSSGRFSAGELLLVGRDGSPLRALVPAGGLHDAEIWQAPVEVRVTADGPADAVDVQAQATLGDALIEAKPVVNFATGVAFGPVTLRHPGAPRLLKLLGLVDPADWLGDGSVSVIAQVAFAPSTVILDRLDAIAADLRGHGRLVLRLGGVPAVSGGLAFDTLPIPLPAAARPLPLDLLQGWQADFNVSAAHLQSAGDDLIQDGTAHVALADGLLRFDGVSATLAGGRLTGSLQLDSRPAPPNFAVQATLRGASIPGPLLDVPVDLTLGSLDARASLAASGYSPSGLAATLTGQAEADVTHGTLLGFDAAGAVAALAQTDPVAVAGSVRQALSGGSTDFDVLHVDVTATPGVLDTHARMELPGATAEVACSFDLGGRRLDMVAQVQPSLAGAPPVTVRLTGPFQALTRTMDLSALVGWLPAR
jgi:hypothetical protein